ncbi:unnamed protein product [Larinioides sclopetarius]|uniref:Uncharacterized protein n=2 Tax=Larinioides sclopetarius TaxID=280406 RepID=A0AAV2BLZ1_9ARAC
MWFLLLSLFVFAEGTTGEIDCNKHRDLQCKRPKMFREIPREKDVFNAQCPDMIKSGKCLEEYDMTCKGEEHRRLMRPERYANILSVLSEICEEGSTLNEVATSNLKCFNETFSNTNCLVEALNFIEPFKEDVPQDEFTGSTYYVPERIFCMAELHLLGCLLEDIARNCGLRARHATVEFLQRTSYAVDECPLESRETLLEDIDTFDLTEGQKSFAISELERMKISNEA